MRLIHCADLHLDAPMGRFLEKEKAKQRRAELLDNFRRLVDYAEDNDVDAVIISGDLFDSDSVSGESRGYVADIIRNHSDIIFFYLSGNHDGENVFADHGIENLKLFKEKWTGYAFGGNVVITGVELQGRNGADICQRLSLPEDKINIVVMHGQISDYGNADAPELINLSALRNKGVDYLALGHIHSYRCEKLDARGVWCYPGCLEGRGFDECGEKGFVLIDIDERKKKLDHQFVPFGRRNIFNIEVDVAGCKSTYELCDEIRQSLDGLEKHNLVRVTLTGEKPMDVAFSQEIIRNTFAQDFYYFDVKDSTTELIDFDAMEKDNSLKGEFVRLVMDSTEVDEKDKEEIISMGIRLLMGEEI